MTPSFPAVLYDLAIIFAVAAAIVAAFGRVGLPSVVGLLTAGAVIGPTGLGLVTEPHRIEGMAELGVVVLLFVIGTELSIARLRQMGRGMLLGGGLQVGVTLVVTVALLHLGGMSVRQGIFWGYLAALSSTAIVVRTLDERGESDALHGRLVLGILLFQDLCVVPMMMSLPMLAAERIVPAQLVFVLVRSLALVGAAFLLARRVVPWVLGHFAASRRREVFLLAVVAVALLVALGTASMGLSLALGGFLAGVILADTPFVYQAQSELVPFRDAFASLFFVSIGMLLDPAAIGAAPAVVLGWFGALVFGKLVITALVALLLRFPARVALRVGFALAGQAGRASTLVLLLSDIDAIRRAAVLAKRRWPQLRVLARVHRASPIDADLADHGVEVVSEEWETVLEVVERVVRRRRRGAGEERRAWPETPFAAGEQAELPDVALDPLVVRAGDRLAGRTLAESRLREQGGAGIVALSRGAHVQTEPAGQVRVEPGDVVLLLGTHAEVARARAWIRREEGEEPPAPSRSGSTP